MTIASLVLPKVECVESKPIWSHLFEVNENFYSFECLSDEDSQPPLLKVPTPARAESKRTCKTYLDYIFGKGCVPHSS